MHAFCDVKIPDPQPLRAVKSFYDRGGGEWKHATWKRLELRKGPSVKSWYPQS